MKLISVNSNKEIEYKEGDILIKGINTSSGRNLQLGKSLIDNLQFRINLNEVASVEGLLNLLDRFNYTKDFLSNAFEEEVNYKKIIEENATTNAFNTILSSIRNNISPNINPKNLFTINRYIDSKINHLYRLKSLCEALRCRAKEVLLKIDTSDDNCYLIDLNLYKTPGTPRKYNFSNLASYYPTVIYTGNRIRKQGFNVLAINPAMYPSKEYMESNNLELKYYMLGNFLIRGFYFEEPTNIKVPTLNYNEIDTKLYHKSPLIAASYPIIYLPIIKSTNVNYRLTIRFIGSIIYKTTTFTSTNIVNPVVINIDQNFNEIRGQGTVKIYSIYLEDLDLEEDFILAKEDSDYWMNYKVKLIYKNNTSEIFDLKTNNLVRDNFVINDGILTSSLPIKSYAIYG